MKTEILQSIQRNFTVNSYVNRGLTLTRGQGMYLYDDQETSYLDLMSNYGVNILGHSHPVISKALSEQLHQLTTLHNSFNHERIAVAAKSLVQRCGGNLSQVFFSNSGAEAIEAALKFAVLATGKNRFIVAEHGYHGKTLGALSATQGAKYQDPFLPLLWEFVPVEFGSIDALTTQLTPETAAVLLEPVQGEGGIYAPPNEYLTTVKKLCSERGILLILDEIQTGCGRTGTFLAAEPADIEYDIVCLGKGLAGGIPIGATVVSQAVGDTIPKHLHTSTFGGNPLACAGVLTVLELLDTSRLEHVKNMGSYFLQELRSLQSTQIIEVRGVGLMIGIEVKSKRDQVLKQLQNNHILAIPAGQSVVRFLPPFIIQKEEVDQVVSALAKILR